MSKDNPFGFVIPNLNDTTCSPDEYWEAYLTIDWIKYYLFYKGRAKFHRLEGNIERATEHEAYAQMAYAKLPDWAKW